MLYSHRLECRKLSVDQLFGRNSVIDAEYCSLFSVEDLSILRLRDDLIAERSFRNGLGFERFRRKRT